MAKIPNSIGLTGPVAPLDSQDTYPTHFSEYGAGGLTAVDAVADLSSIPALRLGDGEPLVYVRETEEWWHYVDGDWILANFQGGHTIQDESISLPNRVNLDFRGEAVVVTDDANTNTTIVTIETAPIPEVFTVVDVEEDGDLIISFTVPTPPVDDWFLDNLDFVDFDFTA